MKELKIESNIIIKNHIGRWYVIDKRLINGNKQYLIEHQTYGEDVPALIIDAELNVLMDNVQNGFSDLDYLEKQRKLFK